MLTKEKRFNFSLQMASLLKDIGKFIYIDKPPTIFQYFHIKGVVSLNILLDMLKMLIYSIIAALGLNRLIAFKIFKGYMNYCCSFGGFFIELIKELLQ